MRVVLPSSTFALNPGTLSLEFLFRVDHEDLVKLDQRERNYERVDVTHMIDVQIEGKVWVYIGLDEAEQCYQNGLKRYNAMICQSYFDLVCNAYRSLGDEAFSNYVGHNGSP